MKAVIKADFPAVFLPADNYTDSCRPRNGYAADLHDLPSPERFGCPEYGSKVRNKNQFSKSKILISV